MKGMCRITIKRIIATPAIKPKRGQAQTRSFVVVAPPFPEVGEMIVLPDKSEWRVSHVKQTRGLAMVIIKGE